VSILYYMNLTMWSADGAHRELMSSAELKKQPRGHFDYCSDGTVYVAKWNDNAVVGVASNCLTHEPVQTAARRVKGASNTAVQQPHIIRQYNEFMGGVDLFDRLLSSYRPMLRGKKWWWPLLLNVVNVAVVAGWRLHCQIFGPRALSHLEFRRQVTLALIKSPNYTRTQLGGGPQGKQPATVQYDGEGHIRAPCDQGRCRVCQKNTRIMCLKCKARLHTDRGKDCFAVFHTQKNDN